MAPNCLIDMNNWHTELGSPAPFPGECIPDQISKLFCHPRCDSLLQHQRRKDNEEEINEENLAEVCNREAFSMNSQPCTISRRQDQCLHKEVQCSIPNQEKVACIIQTTTSFIKEKGILRQEMQQA